jgi:hypothetical protein
MRVLKIHNQFPVVSCLRPNTEEQSAAKWSEGGFTTQRDESTAAIAPLTGLAANFSAAMLRLGAGLTS